MAGAGDNPGVVVPPPLILAASLALGFLLDRFVWPAPIGLDAPAGRMIGGSLIVAGLALALLAFLRFKRAGTAVEPWHPSTALVTDGVYRVTRNPIYLGMALVHLGAASWFDNLWLLLLVPVFMAVIEWGVIRREERYLEAKFGDAYRQYRKGTRRWV